MVKWGALANSSTRRQHARYALSGIADEAAETEYDIINQSINVPNLYTNFHRNSILIYNSYSLLLF